jgi:hypothetical protein
MKSPLSRSSEACFLCAVTFLQLITVAQYEVAVTAPIADLPVQPSVQKYSDFPKPKSNLYPSLSRPTGGAYRDRHLRGAGCGGRKRVADERRASGRRSRVVLTPRRWRQVSGQPRSDGVNKPITGESTKETVKTIRVRECRAIPVRPW